MIKTTINPEFADISDTIGRITREGTGKDARTIYSGRNTLTALPLEKDAARKFGFDEINVKQFRVPHAVNRLVYGNIRPGKAAESYRNSLELLRLGFRVPRPVCHSAERSGILFGRSLYISEQLTDDWQTSRYIEERPDYDDIARDLARYMLSLHRAGVLMKDFSPGNILMRLRDGKREFAMVDVNRMAFGVTSRRRLMHNFATIVDSAEAVAVLARHYAAAAGEEPEKTVREAVRQYTDFISRVTRKRKIKKWFRKKK